ncbi:MAG: type II secretion system major pseudopilin GspG [Planctomycetes bacterium]|nr:type II secretion system major pseudopilin GspG [Planctomycetota bacterium]
MRTCPPPGRSGFRSFCGEEHDPRHTKRRDRRSRAGFTLIELLLVIVIIGTLAAIVIPKFTGRSQEAQVAAVKSQIANFDTCLDMYEMDNGVYPTTDQGLKSLREKPTAAPVPSNWKGPYLKKEIPLDPWQNPYKYVCPGLHNTKGYDLWSFGPDRMEGGSDDIDNWTVGGGASPNK